MRRPAIYTLKHNVKISVVKDGSHQTLMTAKVILPQPQKPMQLSLSGQHIPEIEALMGASRLKYIKEPTPLLPVSTEHYLRSLRC